MKTSLNLSIAIVLLCLTSQAQQASLTIKNKTERHLKIKLMKGPERKAVLYLMDSVAPKSTKMLPLGETGLYFTKTEGILFDEKSPEKNDTAYSKDRPFQVISDSRRGYSNITMEYKEKKSRKQDQAEATPITRKEFYN